MAAALANQAVLKAVTSSVQSSAGDSQAPESECNPTAEQWAAKIQKETLEFKKKLYLLLSESENSQKFFEKLQDSLVNTIKSLPESQYLVRLADQEIFRSLIEQFKLDNDFKKIFSYKLLGGQDDKNADNFLIGKIDELIIKINNDTTVKNPLFTFFLKTQRDEYLKNVNQKAEDNDIKNNQKGGKLTKTRKLKRIKIRINTKKKRSRAQSKRSLRRRQRKRRYPRKTMRGGDNNINVGDFFKSLNSATATVQNNTSNNTSNENEQNDAGDDKKTVDSPKVDSPETDSPKVDSPETDSQEPATNTEQGDDEQNSDKAVEKNYTQDLLKRLTEMDATDSDFRNIILNLIQIACNITLENKKDELTVILKNKMNNYIQHVFDNLKYSTYEVFGYLLFCSFLFDDKENTEFGNYVDEEIVKLKLGKNLTIQNVKNIFQTNILKNDVSNV